MGWFKGRFSTAAAVLALMSCVAQALESPRQLVDHVCKSAELGEGFRFGRDEDDRAALVVEAVAFHLLVVQ